MRDTPYFNAIEVAQLALSGTLGGIGSLCMMEAYHRAPVALVAPFQYTQIFWGAVASYFVWRTLPRLFADNRIHYCRSAAGDLFFTAICGAKSIRLSWQA